MVPGAEGWGKPNGRSGEASWGRWHLLSGQCLPRVVCVIQGRQLLGSGWLLQFFFRPPLHAGEKVDVCLSTPGCWLGALGRRRQAEIQSGAFVFLTSICKASGISSLFMMCFEASFKISF